LRSIPVGNLNPTIGEGPHHRRIRFRNVAHKQGGALNPSGGIGGTDTGSPLPGWNEQQGRPIGQAKFSTAGGKPENYLFSQPTQGTIFKPQFSKGLPGRGHPIPRYQNIQDSRRSGRSVFLQHLHLIPD